MLHMTTSHPTLLRAASYSRYSSDNQRDTSIEDQQRLTDARAAAEAWPMVARFADSEISASTPMALRDDGKRMLAAAARGEFEVLLIEALDRCWRDIVDQERSIRRLEHIGIRIIGLGDGYDTRHDDRELSRGVRGLINQEFLRQLAKKTHRGLTGQVFRGGHAGGLSYGYRSIDAGAIHRLEIDEDQAPWVRWIFEHYAAGWSCQKIAAELNVLGVKTGRGGTWAVSALYGCPNKGSGVLNNELYVGRYVWNRSQWRKDPDTGKRLRTIRPPEEWLIEDRPELRILDVDLWQAVRDRMNGTRLANGGKGKGARPKTLLGGLMTCSKCGGAIIAVSGRDYGCAAHKDRGPAVCTGTRVRRKATDLRLLAVVREDLLSQSAVIELRDQVEALLDAQRKAAAGAAGSAKAALGEVTREIDRLVDAIGAMGHSTALTERLKDAEARLAKLASETARKPAAPIKIDDLMARYRRQLLALETALQAEPERARAALHEYFGDIVVEETGAQAWATFTADPSRLLLRAAGDSGYGCGGRI